MGISSTFIWRRVHSLMGFWLVIYIFEHLLVNSQAAIWLSENGSGFIRMVNTLESLPYLHVIEILLIGIPLAVHAIWGITRIFTSKINLAPSNGAKPSLKYNRNIAYTLQRYSSWILLFGIIGHVAQMRFINDPKKVEIAGHEQFIVKISDDPQLKPLANKIGATLRHQDNQIIASTDTPGTAFLLMVRDTFKSPLMCILYTIFVLAAAFHGFNGFWTFLITWGLILSYRSQKAMVPVCLFGVALLSFFGLAAIWGSYWIGG